MSKALKGSKPGTGESLEMRVLSLGKPCLYLDANATILGCDAVFIKLFKISKKNLNAFPFSSYSQNRLFVEAVRRASTEGISSFRGNVFLANGINPVYLETVCYRMEPEDHSAKKIVCLILGYKFADFLSEHDELKVNALSWKKGLANVSVSVHSMDGSVLYISASIEAMLGYTRDEYTGMSPANLVFPDDFHIVTDAIEKLQQGHDHLNSRYRMIHKNGSVIRVETASFLISNVSGGGNHIVNITRDLNSHEEIEYALERSERKYYRLVMNLPTGIALISSTGQLLEVNTAMKNILGMPLYVPIHDMNFFRIKAMKRMKIAAQLSKCIETKEIVSGDITYSLSNKERGKYLTYSFVPVLNNANEVDNVISYVSDLTLQKKAETEILEHAEFLDLVINAVKSPFFVKDEHHKWVVLNDAAVEMMGSSREALIGKTDYDLYPKEQADIFWKYDELVFKSGSSSNEEQITWSDGKLHTIVTHKTLYLEKSTGKKFIVGTIHDISDYKKIELELRASEHNYHELFDNANDFIITIDLDGNITNANRTLLNFLQTDLSEFLKHSVFDFISDEYLPSAMAFWDKLLAGTLESPFDINALGIDGKPVIYEVKASLMFRNGVLAGAQCVFGDVTELREASMKLEKYNRDLLELNTTKDKFFSIIAHDLRNPYSSLIGFSEMLMEDLNELSKDEIRDSLRIIYNSAKHSFNLLNNLLAWSRLETGHMPFDPAPLTLISVAEEVVEVLFSLAYRKRIEINNRIKPGILAYADKNMLNTILNNLVMNAIKFTPVGGVINIYTGDHVLSPESGKDFITVSVSDTGIGMDEETVSKLFTGIKSTYVLGTEKEEGTGLGLMLAREMVEKHQGRIWVESTLLEGSVFSFLIPAYMPGNGDS